MLRSLFVPLASAVIAVAAFATVATADTNRQPNIVFILCDDLGWGDFGVLHQNDSQHSRSHKTPMIDQMASEGIQLRAHYCPAPVCAPSRASFLTGVHQGHAEVRDNQFDKMLADNHTLGSVLQTAGYRTAMVGKYGLPGEGENAQQWPAYPTKRGFDEYYGYIRHRDGHVHYPADRWELGDSENHRSPKQVWHNQDEVSAGLSKCYTTDLFTARSKDWIVTQTQDNPDQPFFLYLAYDTPHAALQLPTIAYPEGRGLNGGLKWVGKPGQMINTATGTIDDYRHPDYVGKGWSDTQVRFATMIRRIDNCVGDLLQTLRDLNIAEETLVVISSDNGPLDVSYIKGEKIAASAFQSYGPFEGIKRDTWEGGIRMATVAWSPGRIPAGAVDDHASQFHDWMPTFADFAGVAAPARTDGVSLRPSLTGEGTQAPSQIYVEYVNRGKTPDYSDFSSRRRGLKRGQMQVVHLDGFKGVRVDIKSHDDPFEIYDLTVDPKERTNLAGTSARFTQLGQRMKDAALQRRMPNASAPRPYDDVPIPAASDDAIKDSVAGVRWRFFPGEFGYVPRVQGMDAVQDGVVDIIDTAAIDVGKGALELSGWIQVPATGTYHLRLSGNQHAFLRIHDASAIDADARFESNHPADVSLRLSKGSHPFRLTSLSGEQPSKVRLQWSSDGETYTMIPKSALSHPSAP
ncbi:MAG: sulfatase-like hydrolase/transferase [Rubripirellula sp.]